MIEGGTTGGAERGANDVPAPRAGAGIDITSDAFARRLANVLAARRRARGTSIRSLARQSRHAFTAKELHAFEAARAQLDAATVGSVVQLYGADIEEILPERMGLTIRASGVLTTSGLTASFTPDDSTSLLVSYLRLVRDLRAQQQAPTIELRREDVEVLADHIGESGASVVERLGALMGATITQRRAMAGMFLAGALVIGLAGGSVAAVSYGGAGGSGDTGDAAPPTTALVVLDELGSTVAAPDPDPDDAEDADDEPAGASPDAEPVAAVTTVAAPPRTEPAGGYEHLAATTTSTTTAPQVTAPPATTPPAVTTPQVTAPRPTAPSPGGPAPTTTMPATTMPATTVPSETTVPGDVGAGGSIFDDAVPTEAAPLPTPGSGIPGKTGGSTPGTDPSTPGSVPPPELPSPELPSPEPTDQATGAPPVPIAGWSRGQGDVLAGGSGFVANGFSRTHALGAALVDGRLELDATFVSGDGFGVFVRAQLDERDRIVSGWSVQVDASWNKGALLVRRWSNDWEAHPVAAAEVPAERLYGAHRLDVVLAGDHLRAAWNGAAVHVDLADALHRLGETWRTADGDAVGVRTWGDTRLHVHRIALAT